MTENRYSRRYIKRERPRLAVARNPSLSQLLMVFIGLVALALQSFVVQTHIHIPHASGSVQTVSLIALATGAVVDSDPSSGQTPAPRDKYPITEDPSNCPLCQAFAYSGQFVHSVSFLATLPFPVTVRFVIFREIAPALFAASHNWRSRAPPLA